MPFVPLWVVTTLLGSATQVGRNAMQRRLTETIGTVGATQVRFLYGLPFSLIALALILTFTGERLPRPGPGFLPMLVLGAVSQILATALMLAAMRGRSFAVVTALTKTEPIQIAVFGFLVLGDRLSAGAMAAILVATSGVVLMSWTPRLAGEMQRTGAAPILFGLASGALFALSAIGFRGAILAFEDGSALVRSTTALACGLVLQSLALMAWLALFDRAALLGSLREWRGSILAGFLGATASQFWFVSFALTIAANVRTLALVEVLIAQAISRRFLAEAPARREVVGVVLILAGVVGILISST